VTLALPESLHKPLEIPTIEVITASLPETSKRHVQRACIRADYGAAKDDKMSLCWGLEFQLILSTVELVQRLIATLALPIVVDGEGIDAVAPTS